MLANDFLDQHVLTTANSAVYTSYIALFFTLLILLTNGFSVFTKGNWDPESFVASYL